MGGGGIFMAEPEGYDLKRNASLQEVHRCGVAKDVRRDLPTGEGGAILLGLPHCQYQPISDAVTRKGCAAAVVENGLVRSDLVGLAPLLQTPERFRPERDRPEFSSFASQVDTAPVDVDGAKVKGFGDSGAGVVEDREQQVIPSAGPRLCRRAKNSGDLLPGQEADLPSDGPFHRDREYAL